MQRKKTDLSKCNTDRSLNNQKLDTHATLSQLDRFEGQLQEIQRRKSFSGLQFSSRVQDTRTRTAVSFSMGGSLVASRSVSQEVIETQTPRQSFHQLRVNKPFESIPETPDQQKTQPVGMARKLAAFNTQKSPNMTTKASTARDGRRATEDLQNSKLGKPKIPFTQVKTPAVKLNRSVVMTKGNENTNFVQQKKEAIRQRLTKVEQRMLSMKQISDAAMTKLLAAISELEELLE